MKQIHVRGVMHRDLKPENILFGIHENGNKLYLADYGVSKQFIE
jgi:casein kinase I family protein HRR25